MIVVITSNAGINQDRGFYDLHISSRFPSQLISPGTQDFSLTFLRIDGL